MNYNITMVTLAAVLVLGGMVWIARPSPHGNTASVRTSTGVLVADEENFDFGTISMAAGTVRHTFKIKNTSDKSATIGKMYTSCMCTTATLVKSGKQFGPYGMPGHGFIPKIDETMDAGEEATVEVVFDPAAHGPAGVGRIERSITIENNAGQPLELWFTALVTP